LKNVSVKRVGRDAYHSSLSSAESYTSTPPISLHGPRRELNPRTPIVQSVARGDAVVECRMLHDLEPDDLGHFSVSCVGLGM